MKLLSPDARRQTPKLSPGKLLIALFGLFYFAVAAPVWAAPDTPTSDFTDNGDGTVTHSKTGLTWMRCALGQTWTGSGCSGKAKTYTYDQTLTLKQNFAGHDDWRVPNIAELHTITERERYEPAINTEIFPDTPNLSFWSATVYARDPNLAWYVDFIRGEDYHGNGDGDEYFSGHNPAVRLVRGEQSMSASTPASDFIDNGNGTVTHKTTGLTWMRCAIGQRWNGSTCKGSAANYYWQDAMAFTTLFTFAKESDWRLPTAAELLTIVDYSSEFAINAVAFPNAPDFLGVWSSTLKAKPSEYGDAAFVVDFSGFMASGGYGDIYTYTTEYGDNAVRLVRGEWSPAFLTSVDLVTRLSDSPDPVKVGANLQLTATVKNQGTAAANDVALRFTLPRSTTLASLPADCQRSGSKVACTVGVLAADATEKRTIVVSLSKAGGVSFAVAASSDEKDAKPKNNSASAVTAITP